MAKLTKNMKNALAKLEKGKVYSVSEAAALVKEVNCTKFDASVNLAVRLGVDPRKANQMVRGVVSLDVNSWGVSACYPRRPFYPLIDGPSIQNHRITKT